MPATTSAPRFVRDCRIRLAGLLLVVTVLSGAMIAPKPIAAATLDGVSFPDSVTVEGSRLLLNGVGLRTYSFLKIRIYVAALYLSEPSHDAGAILRSPGPKMLMLHFVRSVTTDQERKAWRDGLLDNCVAPCHIDPGDLARFLAALKPIHAGDQVVLLFDATGMTAWSNGTPLGKVPDPGFASALLATFLGPRPATEQLKRGLLGS